MRTSNLANEALRHADVGFVYEEKLTNASGSIEVAKFATVRVRAAAAGTVTIDGILAVTMANNEIVVLNAGNGDPTNTAKLTVTIALSAAAYVQVARDVPRKAP